jgi:hypothetical protein
MKKVHILRRGQLNTTTNRYEFHDIEPFSSFAKAMKEVNKAYEINKGTDFEQELLHNGEWIFTYNCLSTDGKPIRVRDLIVTKEVR